MNSVPYTVHMISELFKMYVCAKFVMTSSVFSLFVTVELQIKFEMFAQSPWCCAVCKKVALCVFLKRSITMPVFRILY